MKSYFAKIGYNFSFLDKQFVSSMEKLLTLEDKNLNKKMIYMLIKLTDYVNLKKSA